MTFTVCRTGNIEVVSVNEKDIDKMSLIKNDIPILEYDTMILVDKEMSKSDLRKKAEIAPNTMTELRRDEEVSLTILS